MLINHRRNILDGVASQEADLKRKAHKIEEWHSLHKDALDLAAKTKQKLIEFEVISEADDEETKVVKTKKKTAINSNLDALEKQLKKINNSEKKYRSRQCVDELKELNDTIKKIQSKHKLLTTTYNLQTSDLDALRKDKQQNEQKIKDLIEANKKNMETIKREMSSKHKDYIQNLQSQHDNLLKKQKEDCTKNMEKQWMTEKQLLNGNIQKLENEILRIKQEHSEEMEMKMDKLSMEKEMQISKLQKEYNAIDDKLVLAQVEISELKQREEAHKELMLKWQAQKEKKNEKINELTKKMQCLTDDIERMQNENQSLQETAAFASIQITQKDEKLNEIETKFGSLQMRMDQNEKDKKLLEAKLKVSIKEIIKLRQDTKDKDENRNLLLTQMSNLEFEKDKIIKSLNESVAGLKNEIALVNKECLHKFKALNENLNDTHSKLESFSVTIKNFSGRELLRESYDTELEARTKSNEELSAWLENIRIQTQRATEQMSMNEIVMMNSANDGDEKTNGVIKESETQIAHIRLTGLQLLENYTSALLSYNHLFIEHAKKKENELQKRRNSKFRNILNKK